MLENIVIIRFRDHMKSVHVSRVAYGPKSCRYIPQFSHIPGLNIIIPYVPTECNFTRVDSFFYQAPTLFFIGR